DASTDSTGELVEKYVAQQGQQHRFTLIENKEQNGPLACMCAAIYLCDKKEIVIDLDGNDWLAHEDVLSYLNNVYANPDIWMTYGQFIYYHSYARGFASEIPSGIIEKNGFRFHSGCVTHLRTFYAGLFHEIKKEDFFYQDRFIQKAGDLAYLIPLLEMAGAHSRFIPEVLYVYNDSNPLNHHKISTSLETSMDQFIRKKEKYEPLSKFPSYWLPLYSQIEDIYHPTLEDYRFIQNFLTYGKRDRLEQLGDMFYRARNVRIVGDKPEQFPQSGSVAVNCDENERENCILLYATFNQNYPNGIRRLLHLLMESDFQGHVLYRLGGWPNVEGGSLVLAHVPYGFKVSFLKEALRLGYKRALWLDVSIIPLVSLNTIFKMIKEKGCFIMGNDRMVGPYMNRQAAAFFGLNLSQTLQVPSCSAGVFGIYFSNPIGKNLLERWHYAACDKDAFFSARSDQSALSLILHQLGIHDFIDLNKMPHSEQEINQDSLFWLDREFIY
ncbi:MAG: hypothetical protein ACM3JI_02750, partial [Anaerolineae bacterium]